jgi:hypothetical protein
MKKIILLAAVSISGFAAKAQDTLIWNNFENDPFTNMQIAIPPGYLTDTSWYTFDLDGNADGSSTNRPGEWYWSAPFAPGDTLTGNTGVMASNSWSNSNTPNENILVTPSVYIGDTTAVLSWKSAPYQTPRYLDGYQVLIAVGNNDISSFTDTIFKASEYVSLDVPAFPYQYGAYTFLPGPTANPLAPFVHGMDSTYTEFDPASDSSRLLGRLRPFTYSLAAYNGQTIFIMFRHYCTDDNLLSLDDILVTGTDYTGIHEANSGVSFSTYPNPAKDELNISYELTSSSNVVLNVYNIEGKLMSSENKGILSGAQTNRIDISNLPAGMYRVELVTEMGRSNQKIVVQ